MATLVTPPRVRVAPSPTGDPHVGTAYMALFNYAFAKQHGGKFLLRIEDTDRTRSTPESEAAILRALGWLGVAWDEGPDVGGPFGPYRQSERSAIYAEHGKILIDRGRAYRCFCTAERLAALREDQKRLKQPPGYDGLCRKIAVDEAARRAAGGEAHVVRLAMPREGKTIFQDRLRGPLEFDNAQIDDQVLLKSDGFPTYHLANVVDDHLMQITHVIRAEEWISSTPKHVVLYDAFGWAAPEWIHMPLLRNADKTKISKRKNPVSLDYYKDTGILPEALRNFLGLMGWSFGDDREKFTLDEMVAAFSWDKISLGGPVFDLEKLAWLNGLYMRELGAPEMVRRLRAWKLDDARLEKIAALLGERLRRMDEFVGQADFFFAGDLDYRAVEKDLVPKERTPKDTATLLGELSDELDLLKGAFEAKALEDFARRFGEAKGWKTKELFMTLRVVVTGRATSPPLFESMELVGKELTRRRLRNAITFLAQKR